MLSNQEAFTKVVSHLRKQGKKAVNAGTCRYRTSDGLKCAIGCLIPDDQYYPNMEGVGIQNLITPNLQNYLPDIQFCIDLQRLHDQNDSAHWEKIFSSVADDYSLTLEPL